MDPSLWKELEAWAQEDLRSVNGQMEFLLRQAVQKRKRQTNRPPPQNEDSDDSP